MINNIKIEYLYEILDQAKNGIVLTDPNQHDNPIIYVNKYFTQLTGYRLDEVVGKNCRFMQRNDNNQEEVKTLKAAISEKKSITVVLKNYKKDGELYYNELTVSPIFDKENSLKYFLGIQKDVTLEKVLKYDLELSHALLEKSNSELEIINTKNLNKIIDSTDY